LDSLNGLQQINYVYSQLSIAQQIHLSHYSLIAGSTIFPILYNDSQAIEMLEFFKLSNGTSFWNINASTSAIPPEGHPVILSPEGTILPMITL